MLNRKNVLREYALAVKYAVPKIAIIYKKCNLSIRILHRQREFNVGIETITFKHYVRRLYTNDLRSPIIWYASKILLWQNEAAFRGNHLLIESLTLPAFSPAWSSRSFSFYRRICATEQDDGTHTHIQMYMYTNV